MSYFNDVYLKRINREGYTQQERVKTKKQQEFDKLILRKSQYQAKIYQRNDEKIDIVCTLHPTIKNNETSVINRLMTSTSAPPLKTGDILRIFQKISDEEYDKIWLVLFCEDNITRGYYCYRIICLDSILNICDEYGNTIHSIPVKFIDSRGELVKDYFIFTAATNGYREPNKETRFVTRDFDFLKNDTYFEYKERGFEIIGKDNLSIENVAYVSFGEKLIREPEPISSSQIEVGKDKNFFLNNR